MSELDADFLSCLPPRHVSDLTKAGLVSDAFDLAMLPLSKTKVWAGQRTGHRTAYTESVWLLGVLSHRFRRCVSAARNS
jgi:hypothetical protein